MNETQQAVLEFEARWTRRYGDKAGSIGAELGLSLTAYDAILEDLIDLRAASDLTLLM